MRRDREYLRRKWARAALAGAASLFLLTGCGAAEETAQTGLDQLAQGAYAEAAESFSQAIEELKWYDAIDKTQLLLYRAEALMGAGEFVSARTVYDGLLEDEPDNADYALYAGLASLGAEDYVKAEKRFETAIENDNTTAGSIAARYYAGEAAEAQKAYTTAAAYYAEAKRLTEDDDSAAGGDGTAENAAAAATDNTENAVQGESVTYAEICTALARCLMQTEEYEDALSAAEDGLLTAQEPELQSLLYTEAVAYEYLGDFETAREKMDAYVQQYPDDADAQKEDTFLQTR